MIASFFPFILSKSQFLTKNNEDSGSRVSSRKAGGGGEAAAELAFPFHPPAMWTELGAPARVFRG